ncbi:uncharacterized protein LOC123695126 [Colias croceus]|uniref:uncharacterized protein LOC123695126 n=1 Tax=Colias crocea TaxID=72248 RepID=UPI001E27FC7B|nr:uncharacterized protein LOC123695126 [Colias croceus]XP_045496816.1 uncharacterized protein LOC123695126 [Colias croceus]
MEQSILENYDHASSIVRRVLDRCRYEKQMGYLINPIRDHYSRTAYYTGRSVEFLKKVDTKLNDFQNIRHKYSEHGYIILKAISKVLLKNKLPIFNNSYPTYINICLSDSIEPLQGQQFKDMLEIMGITLNKVKGNGLMLLENPKNTFERYKYLSKALQYRNTQKNFYYLDERYIDGKLQFEKPWLRDTLPDASSNINCEVSSGCMFYYMVSVVGYVSGLFCSSASDDGFQKWLIEIAIPKLQPKSVIVMDRSCYQKLFEQTITRFDSRQEMIEWLQDKQVPYDSSMRKAELYDLIRNTTGIKKYTNTYHLVRAFGHDILCLPSIHLKLSLADTTWTMLKNVVWPSDRSLIGIINNCVLSNISSIPKSEWEREELNIINREKEIYSTDLAVENYLEANGIKNEKSVKKMCDCNEFCF